MAKQEIKYREVVDGLEGAPKWITTFVDMISLLVTFFILLYTFSSVREFNAFTYPQNVISTSGVFKGDASDTMVAPKDDLMLAMDLARGSRKRHTRPVNELRENMEEMGQRLTDEHVPMDLRRVGDGMTVKFGPAAAFDAGDTTPSRALRTALVELADTLQYYPLMVVVEGHTSDAFAASPTHPDEHALSIARARAAATVLVDVGGFDPTLVMLEGHGSSQPQDENAASAVERATNRRVEVRLVPMSRDRMAALSLDPDGGDAR